MKSRAAYSSWYCSMKRSIAGVWSGCERKKRLSASVLIRHTGWSEETAPSRWSWSRWRRTQRAVRHCLPSWRCRSPSIGWGRKRRTVTPFSTLSLRQNPSRGRRRCAWWSSAPRRRRRGEPFGEHAAVCFGTAVHRDAVADDDKGYLFLSPWSGFGFPDKNTKKSRIPGRFPVKYTKGTPAECPLYLRVVS